MLATAAISLALAAGCNAILGIEPPNALPGGPDGSFDAAPSDSAPSDGVSLPETSIKDGGGCEATFCDDFERTVPVPSGDPRWVESRCPFGTLEVTKGNLVVNHPRIEDGGVVQCALFSKSSMSRTPR